MANENQFKHYTKFIGTRGVREYRATIEHWVRPDDVVLEIGCEWGTTSCLIAPHCAQLVATDISPECLERGRELHPEVRFEQLDGFDVRAALDFGLDFSLVYIDMSGLSGYRSLLDTIALLQMYATVLRPRAIIIKSGSLKRFAGQCVAWSASHSSVAARDREDAGAD